MESLYRELIAEGETAILRLIENGQPESLQLEFKTKDDRSNGKLSKSDKRTLGRALSGFSNSMGGLLVWGVDARSGPDDVDCAQNPRPIAEIKKFESRVNDLVGEYLMPRNEDVQIAKIDCTDNSDEGYLLMWIGRSDRRPHRSEAPSDGRYYKRVGSSFYPMEHYEIEDMMNRNAPAELELYWEFVRQGTNSGTAQDRSGTSVFIIGLSNSSRISARYPYIHAADLHGSKIWPFGIDGNHNYGLPWKTSRGGAFFGGGSDDLVHPNQQLPVFGVEVEWKYKTGQFQLTGHHASHPIEIDCVFGCADSRKRQGTVTIPLQDIRQKIINLQKLHVLPDET